jgi:hypothetical protein
MGRGTLVAIDCEFVAAEKDEFQMRSDGSQLLVSDFVVRKVSRFICLCCYAGQASATADGSRVRPAR